MPEQEYVTSAKGTLVSSADWSRSELHFLQLKKGGENIRPTNSGTQRIITNNGCMVFFPFWPKPSREPLNDLML
jgi:hypothetical protein